MRAVTWLWLLPFIALALASLCAWFYQPAPWCFCGHDDETHRHDRSGTDCSQCTCPRFSAPLIRRIT